MADGLCQFGCGLGLFQTQTHGGLAGNVALDFDAFCEGELFVEFVRHVCGVMSEQADDTGPAAFDGGVIPGANNSGAMFLGAELHIE